MHDDELHLPSFLLHFVTCYYLLPLLNCHTPVLFSTYLYILKKRSECLTVKCTYSRSHSVCALFRVMQWPHVIYRLIVNVCLSVKCTYCIFLISSRGYYLFQCLLGCGYNLRAGKKLGWGQYHSAVKYIHIQSRVLARVCSATTHAPQRVHVTDLMVLWCMHVDTLSSSIVCQQWARLSRPRSLLRHQLPPLQVNAVH